MTTSQTGKLAHSLSIQKEAFLKAVQDNDIANWILVTGNESADLDSLVSALAFAYLAQTSHLTPHNYIALYQQSSDLLHLRPENQYAFERVSLSISKHLLLLDDIPSETLSQLQLNIALVDHNRLDSIFSQNAQVVSVIDHHQDEGLYPNTTPRLITVPNGSCTSLVVTFFKDHIGNLPAELADLLLSAVLIDTANLKTSAGKAEAADFEAVSLLTSRLQAALPNIQLNMKDQFTELKRQKYDVSKLSSYDLLIRDFKTYQVNEYHLGLSTVPLSFVDWSDKFGWQAIDEALLQLMEKKQLNVAGVLTSFVHKDKDQRQVLVVIKPDGASLDRLSGLLQEEGKEALDLQPWSGQDNPSLQHFQVRGWDQGKPKATRKISAPVFVAALQAL